jgi:hypothetical protein
MDSGTLFFLRVQVWAMFLQAATFGVYSITCAYCFLSFFGKRSRHRGLTELNWPMLIIFLIFLLKAGSHAAISIYLNFEMATSDSREDAAMEFMDRTDLVNIARVCTTTAACRISTHCVLGGYTPHPNCHCQRCISAQPVLGYLSRDSFVLRYTVAGSSIIELGWWWLSPSYFGWVESP